MNYGLTVNSKNVKTGPTSNVMAPNQTCPARCPMRDACYARCSPMAIHWGKLSRGERGVGFAELVRQLRQLEPTVVRYGDAGDLPGKGNAIAKAQAFRLADALSHCTVIAYTHKPLSTANVTALQGMRDRGMVVNASCETIDKVKRAHSHGIPTALLIRSGGEHWTMKRVEGERVVRCPAEYSDVQCKTCGGAQGPLCSRGVERRFVVGFTTHGTRKKLADAIVG